MSNVSSNFWAKIESAIPPQMGPVFAEKTGNVHERLVSLSKELMQLENEFLFDDDRRELIAQTRVDMNTLAQMLKRKADETSNSSTAL